MRPPAVSSRAAPGLFVTIVALHAASACARPYPPPSQPVAPPAPPTQQTAGEPRSQGAPASSELSAVAVRPGVAPAAAGAAAAGPSPGEQVEPAATAGPPPPFRAPLPGPDLARAAPARRIADLSPAACRVELARSGLPVERDRRPTPGVATATRVTGPFHGVRLVVPPRSSPYGVLDCRLTLALGELAALLAEHGVVAVRIDNTYRPRAHLPGSRRPSQHNYALAADVTAFTLADGRTLEIERDWPAAIGAPACGPEAELGSDTPEALELRNLVCAIAARQLFHHILTPNYDVAHRNHLHLDLQRDNTRGNIR